MTPGMEELLMERVGKGVEVELVDKTRRRGFVYTVDPISHNTVMLTKPEGGAGEAGNWGASMLFNGAVKSVADAPIVEIDFASMEQDHPLTRRDRVPAEEHDPAKVAERLESVKDRLSAHRVSFTVQEGTIVILDGVARLPAPYSKHDIVCQNPVVLERMRRTIFHD
ncbi:hypothetical protein GUITHDRAFT_107797 [Guillardia theta CCMP2712]|uniref:AD domain-containing protein n=1 Tax=Guillardia theta (strain CCMP2712) TaxID=905079 RepID=L1JDJ0_GUITC|nr:hypothetical protein GUITHDRAFT_107797 [Guillardia theta CCMP2712]EKX46180.1 hypothetical protein GUITHDRAFT_107797 [Guillardia theta CCMP2712]|eukprot:XP_005833160.1 hypothetical protein GUITHDRAFT_107797 [Guillardia theta CCMP2712]